MECVRLLRGVCASVAFQGGNDGWIVKCKLRVVVRVVKMNEIPKRMFIIGVRRSVVNAILFPVLMMHFYIQLFLDAYKGHK